MTSLYELTEDYKKILELMYDGDMDEDTLKDTLELVEFEIEEKAENYAKIIKMLEGDATILKNEAERLILKKERLEKRIRLMKDSLKATMVVTGKRKIKTPLFVISIAKNGGLQPIEITGTVPDEFKITPEPIPNNEAIRQALQSGPLPWAKLKERGEHLNIR